MSIDKKETRKVAHLARIEMTEEQTEKTTPELGRILKLMETLDKVDTQDVEPLANVADIDLRLREDVVNDGNCAEAVLANAPEDAQGYFVVPKVVE